MLIKVKLIESDRQTRLPQQFAQPPHGSGMFGAFVTVADENLIEHCREQQSFLRGVS